MEIWPTLDERLGGSTGYQRTGGLRLIEKEYVGGSGGRVSLDAQAWMQNQAGIYTTILRRHELLELEPGISDLITHALHVPADGIAPQAQTTALLAHAARRAGATLVENMPAISLSWTGGRVTSVRTPGGSYKPRKAVIVAANAETASILGAERNPVPGWSVIPQATFVQPLRPHTLRHLVNHESRPLSLKAGPDGSVQISGGLRGLWDPIRRVAQVDDAVVNTALNDAAAVYPELTGARVVATEAGGPEACSPDGIPVIDKIPGSDNAYVATHWTGHGFALFPAVVEALCSWVLHGSKPEILAPFAVSRFKDARRAETASSPAAASTNSSIGERHE